MKLSEYRNSSSWQKAIDLGPKLMALAEELPASEETGLSLQLRQLMVELPATIAADLVQEHSDERLMPALKLLATLELIDRVYPALDTAGVRSEADALAEGLVSGEPAARDAEPPQPAPAPERELEPAATPVLASEVGAGSEVSVSPDGTVGDQPAEPAAASAPAPTIVPVTTASEPSPQESNVHSDSQQ
ncbi:MAG TPA: four helix bundle protein [Candidatus Saccharimonadia bacterium]|nr:four helix bundle protein [Candidatus Saccharimonadia bacterium]